MKHLRFLKNVTPQTKVKLPLITPMIRGWGMADFICNDCSYNACCEKNFFTIMKNTIAFRFLLH